MGRSLDVLDIKSVTSSLFFCCWFHLHCSSYPQFLRIHANFIPFCPLRSCKCLEFCQEQMPIGRPIRNILEQKNNTNPTRVFFNHVCNKYPVPIPPWRRIPQVRFDSHARFKAWVNQEMGTEEALRNAQVETNTHAGDTW